MSNSVDRVQRYLGARKKMRQLDQAWIHWINEGEESEAELRAEDIAVLLRQRAELLEALKITRGNIASLGPAGALTPYTSYQEWLAMVDDVIAKALGEKP